MLAEYDAMVGEPTITFRVGRWVGGRVGGRVLVKLLGSQGQGLGCVTAYCRTECRGSCR